MKITLVEEFFSCTYFKSRTSDDTIVIKKFNSSNYVKEFTNIDILIKFIDLYDYATIMVNPILKYAESINLTNEDIELIKSNNITVYHYKKDNEEIIYLINNDYQDYENSVSVLDEKYCTIL